MTSGAIRHRLDDGRLHRLLRGVYAVGRADVGERGHWLAAVLASGPEALLSHHSAAALWGIHRTRTSTPVHVVVARATTQQRSGVRIHRRVGVRPQERHVVDGIPVTGPVSTLVDIALSLSEDALEAAVNEASHRNLIGPEALRAELDDFPRRPGVGRLRRLLDRDGYVVTDTWLERRFLPIARQAGLAPPRTQAWLNGYRVDFYWPELGLVVEADSLRYHRTAASQAADHRRDQAHTAAGLTTLRFTRGQIVFETEHVRDVLTATGSRLGRSAGSAQAGARRASRSSHQSTT
jgi:very-short-patch-repair endonuclease